MTTNTTPILFLNNNTEHFVLHYSIIIAGTSCGSNDILTHFKGIFVYSINSCTILLSHVVCFVIWYRGQVVYCQWCRVQEMYRSCGSHSEPGRGQPWLPSKVEEVQWTTNLHLHEGNVQLAVTPDQFELAVMLSSYSQNCHWIWMLQKFNVIVSFWFSDLPRFSVVSI